MTLDLSGACSKLERALYHLNALGDEMEALDLRARETTVAEEEVYPHPNGYRHLFRIGEVTPTSPVTPLIVGDYIHNLRSALDHVAWELVQQGSATRYRDTSVQFPIYGIGKSADPRKSTFASKVDDHLPGITRAQRTVVENVQPYHRGKWHLAALRNLSNDDKHREITPIRRFGGNVTRQHLTASRGNILEWRVLLPEGRRVTDHTPFLEVVVDHAATEVLLLAQVGTPVAFEDRRARRALRPPALEDIGEKVAEVVGEFANRWGRLEHSSYCSEWPARGRASLGL